MQRGDIPPILQTAATRFMACGQQSMNSIHFKRAYRSGGTTERDEDSEAEWRRSNADEQLVKDIVAATRSCNDQLKRSGSIDAFNFSSSGSPLALELLLVCFQLVGSHLGLTAQQTKQWQKRINKTQVSKWTNPKAPSKQGAMQAVIPSTIGEEGKGKFDPHMVIRSSLQLWEVTLNRKPGLAAQPIADFAEFSQSVLPAACKKAQVWLVEVLSTITRRPKPSCIKLALLFLHYPSEGRIRIRKLTPCAAILLVILENPRVEQQQPLMLSQGCLICCRLLV